MEKRLEMNELSQKLKAIAASTYSKFGEEKSILIRGYKAYTGKEIAKEIEDETELGMRILSGLLKLTIDLVKRDKVNVP
jgi:hypothetical protein